MFEWFQEGTNIGFGMILRPLKLATWLELLKDLEKKKDLHFDFLVKWELVNFETNKVESFNLLLDRNKMEKWDKIENWTQNKPRIEDKMRNENRTKIEIGNWKKKWKLKKLEKLRNENWKRIQNILAVQRKLPNSSLPAPTWYLKSEIERKM